MTSIMLYLYRNVDKRLLMMVPMMLKITMEDVLMLTNKTRTPAITLMLIMSRTSLKSYLNSNNFIEYENVKKSRKNICNTELFY